MKSYKTPHKVLLEVLSAACILMGIQNPEWKDCQRLIGNIKNIELFKDFDKDNVSRATLAKLRQYTRKETFNPDHIKGISEAAVSIAKWVLAVEKYCEYCKAR